MGRRKKKGEGAGGRGDGLLEHTLPVQGGTPALHSDVSIHPRECVLMCRGVCTYTRIGNVCVLSTGTWKGSLSDYEYFKAEMLKAFGSSFLKNKCKSRISASGQEAGVGIHDPLAGLSSSGGSSAGARRGAGRGGGTGPRAAGPPFRAPLPAPLHRARQRPGPSSRAPAAPPQTPTSLVGAAQCDVPEARLPEGRPSG